MLEGEITELLIAHREGDRAAFEKLIPLVYPDLRRLAHAQLNRGRPGQTLNTTALVHEAYLKLVDQPRVSVNDRNHFFCLAARVMRQIVVDFARRRAAAKRGGGKIDLSLEEIQVSVQAQAESMLAIDQALKGLSELNERLTQVFECRFFGGMSEQETADALDLSLRTVQRDWMKGRAWLRRELTTT